MRTGQSTKEVRLRSPARGTSFVNTQSGIAIDARAGQPTPSLTGRRIKGATTLLPTVNAFNASHSLAPGRKMCRTDVGEWIMEMDATTKARKRGSLTHAHSCSGDFHQGICHGYGVYETPRGRYEGSWVDGKVPHQPPPIVPTVLTFSARLQESDVL